MIHRWFKTFSWAVRFLGSCWPLEQKSPSLRKKSWGSSSQIWRRCSWDSRNCWKLLLKISAPSSSGYCWLACYYRWELFVGNILFLFGRAGLGIRGVQTLGENLKALEDKIDDRGENCWKLLLWVSCALYIDGTIVRWTGGSSSWNICFQNESEYFH